MVVSFVLMLSSLPTAWVIEEMYYVLGRARKTPLYWQLAYAINESTYRLNGASRVW